MLKNGFDWCGIKMSRTSAILTLIWLVVCAVLWVLLLFEVNGGKNG